MFYYDVRQAFWDLSRFKVVVFLYSSIEYVLHDVDDFPCDIISWNQFKQNLGFDFAIENRSLI